MGQIAHKKEENSMNYEICNRDLYRGTSMKGVLFDMDGVVLDTEKLYTRFWIEAAVSLGYPMTREMALGMRSLNRTMGEQKLKEYLGENVDYHAIRQTRVQIMETFIKENGVEVKEGIFELLAFLKENNIKTAIATSSPLERAEKHLSQVGLFEKFDAVVSGHMVAQGKPAPDIYLYAAEKLGFLPQECLALEDSPAGILSAYRAGCVPILIPDQDKPNADIKKQVYAVAENLSVLRDKLGVMIQNN